MMKCGRNHLFQLDQHPWYVKALLIFLFACYLIYSFIQHYHIPILGDLSQIIAPAEAYKAVLNHPFGLPALLEGKMYAAPNRFAAHGSLYVFYHTIPEFLQTFISPVNSFYAATALGKTLIQAGLIILIARFAFPKGKIWQLKSLAIMLLVAPLFQVNGYNLQIGVIDKSVAYTFFYGGSLLAVGLFFLPFRKGLPNRNEAFGFWPFVGCLFLSVLLPFQGPLNQAILLLLIPTMTLTFWLKEAAKKPGNSLFKRFWQSIGELHPLVFALFIIAGLLSLYSLYIGQFNVEDQWSTLPLLERYQRLPEGLAEMFGSKIGPAMLIGFIGLNTFLVWRFGDADFRKWYLWIFLIAMILITVYTLLLPLGGYREYRPLIIRRDTYAPVLLGLFYLYGIASLYLLKHLQVRFLKWLYPVLLGGFVLVFLTHDGIKWDGNTCEKAGIYQIQESQKDTVAVEGNCPVLAWSRFEDPGRSKVKTKTLRMMNILEREKWYYHQKE